MFLEFEYIHAVVFTVVIELVVAVLFGYRRKDSLFAIAFINLLTNPILNYTLFVLGYTFSVYPNTLLVLFFEMIVVLVEWRLLLFSIQDDSKKLLKLSFVMNLFSFLIGVVFFW